MEGRLGVLLLLLLGVGTGIVFGIPKIRRRVVAGVIRAGEMTKEGYLGALKMVKQEKVKVKAATAKIIKRTRPVKTVIIMAKKAKAGTAKMAKKANIRTAKKIRPSVTRKVEAIAASATKSPNLSDDIIRKLNESPGGLRLADLGAKLGMHFVRLAVPIKKLLAEGKIEKEGKLYVAVA